MPQTFIVSFSAPHMHHYSETPASPVLVCANLHLHVYWRINDDEDDDDDDDVTGNFCHGHHTANCCPNVHCVHIDHWANETRMSGGWGIDPGSLYAWTRPGPPTMPRLEGGLSHDLRRWRFSRTPPSVTERDWKLLYWQSIADDLVAVICHFTPRNTSMSSYKGRVAWWTGCLLVIVVVGL